MPDPNTLVLVWWDLLLKLLFLFLVHLLNIDVVDRILNPTPTIQFISVAITALDSDLVQKSVDDSDILATPDSF